MVRDCARFWSPPAAVETALERPNPNVPELDHAGRILQADHTRRMSRVFGVDGLDPVERDRKAWYIHPLNEKTATSDPWGGRLSVRG